MAGPKKTILLIEDEPHIVLGLRDALEFEGFRVVAAARGREGVTLARSETPDAIILDLMLPDMNGYAICEEIRRLDGVVPNKNTVKVLRPLRPKLETLARLAKFRVTLNAVIGSAPATEAQEVVNFARDHGFQPRVCLIHDHTGQIKLSPEETEVFMQIRKTLGRGFREGADYRTRLLEEGKAPYRCRAGSRFLYVDENGMVSWCSQQRAAFAVPLDQYTPKHLKEQFHTPKTCADSCTVGCVRTCSQYDNWRPQSRHTRD